MSDVSAGRRCTVSQCMVPGQLLSCRIRQGEGRAAGRLLQPTIVEWKQRLGLDSAVSWDAAHVASAPLTTLSDAREAYRVRSLGVTERNVQPLSCRQAIGKRHT